MDHNLPPWRPPHPHLSPRRELPLRGPRPSPLRVRKDSHKIMKPPPPQPREPVIIYTISPKVIHVEPANFMGLVQRLTGPSREAADRPMTSVAIPGILSPVPALLPPISPTFFSPTSLDPSFHNLFQDMSPAGFQAGRLSPAGNFGSPSIGLSPGAAGWDIFNQLSDFYDWKKEKRGID